MSKEVFIQVERVEQTCDTPRNVLLVNIGRLKKESYIDDNVSENTLRAAVMYIQDMIVERVVGTTLFEALKDMVFHNCFENPDYRYYKILLDDYLFPIYVYGAQAEISIPLSYKSRNAGTVQNVSDDKVNVPLSDIKYLNQYYSNKKDFYVKRAIDFLRANREEFCELVNCCCAWCERPLNMDHTTPLNLRKDSSAYEWVKRRRHK